jgi:hypothetical protein
MRLTQRLALLIAIATATLCACGGQPQQESVSNIDETTGESFSHSREPVHLITQRPALSAIGKDYLIVSPVTVNSSGSAQTFLWFALGSTIDRVITGAETPSFETIVLVVDGSMMTFDLIPWSEIATALPADVSIKTHASFASKITRNQLNRIAAANTLEAFVTDEDYRSPLYLYSQGVYSEWGRF